jgi:arylsulfatase A-like enzyme
MRGRLTTNRRSLLASAAAVAALTALPVPSLAQARKPNFIVVMTDDLGFGDITTSLINTPNLDRMVAEGMTLTSYHSPAPVCTPSRAGMLTGRFPIRNGMTPVLHPWSNGGLPLEEVTIAKLLKPDYATALFGKWHLGHKGQHWPPTNHGFDRYFGIPYSHDMRPLNIVEATAEHGVINQMPVDFDYNGASATFDPATEEPASLTSQLQQQFYGAAEQFIEQNRDRPFYVELWLSSPHLPEIPAEQFKGTTDAGPYGDMVAEIDSIMGRLRGKLQELGLERDTLVLFTSDNGAWYWGSSGDRRDRKGSGSYNGGTNVPFIAVQPGTVPPGQRVDHLASGLDVLPTFARMAGKALPAGLALDGFDITPILTAGQPSARNHLVMFADQDVVGVRTTRWKYLRQRHYDVFGYDELYDLQKDPSESYNLRDRYPEVVADMAARLAAAKAEFEPLKREYPPMTMPPLSER